ncbi:MAG: hypothetical protein IVW36_11490 [Dehalococcoidia bacterium]|nr:hypothetical protein [Dehalococcoidia bacterium]
MSSDTARYVQRLRGHLHLGEALESDFLREIEAHMDDRVAALVARGVPERRARRTVLEGFGRPQTLAHLMRQAHQTASWTEALLGATPFALLAVLLGLGLWRLPIAAAFASGIVIVVTVYGLWLGRPAWFYPWAGVAMLMPLFAGYIAFAVLSDQAPAVAAGHATVYTLAGIAGAALYFPVGLVVVAAGVLVAARRDWLDASILLSPLPIALVWIIALHRAGGLFAADASLRGLAPMLGVIALCAMLGTVVFLRATTRTLKFLTLVASALVLLSTATLLVDPSGGLVTLAGRAAILLAFLLSPALVARRA